MAPTSTKQRRAIGIVRVSQVNGHEGDSFASPAEQRDRIEDEANVSGGQVERLIAREALASVGIRRLMTVPRGQRDRGRQLYGRDRRH